MESGRTTVLFGKFEFDAVTRRLRRDGEDIHLPPKAFELLAALIEMAPGVLSKRELHARLWPGGMVADATLVALVKQLRAALGDRDRPQPLIRTVHRVGYALDAPITHREGAPPAVGQCWLTVDQRRIPLLIGDNIVGRDDAARVRLDEPMVSRRHARIVVGDSATSIEDLGSKNGTFIDGRRIDTAPVPLANGVRIAFGTLVVAYGESSAALATFTHVGPADH